MITVPGVSGESGAYSGYHSNCLEPRLHQLRPFRYRKFRAPQPKSMAAVRIQVHLRGNPGLLQGNEISQRIVHTVDVVILGLQQKCRRCPAGNMQIRVQRKIRVRDRLMFG